MSYIQLTNAQTSSQRHTPTITSHNPGRSQLVAVPSSNILEKASASERVFWSSISDAVKSNTEDRSEIRTLIRHIRESFAKIREDEHPTEEVQRAHDIVVGDLRSTIVELLSSNYKSSSVVQHREAVVHMSSQPITNTTAVDKVMSPKKYYEEHETLLV